MKQKKLTLHKPCTVHLSTVHLLLLLSLITFSFTACNEDDETNEQWKQENLKAYDDLDKSIWLPLETKDGPTGIYYKIDPDKEKAEKGTEHPIQTAAVTINYTGTFYTQAVFDSNTNTTFKVNGVVRGFGVALQNMVVGDAWDVCIPYYLGYGTTATGSIKAYTTLFFNIELLKIDQYPQ
ncbi:MAG: FKBP-type peptidyl-prolyl cis-trans isomerase [Candidatus Symbiothrix sp.]|jgi:FKBP-type peptidyl-prolyl cis-trans isomerase|nr:FKBP-type peptidyl-prolyl cis-trans isomerase [Candidatus Symbiothrix sp.]